MTIIAIHILASLVVGGGIAAIYEYLTWPTDEAIAMLPLVSKKEAAL